MAERLFIKTVSLFFYVDEIWRVVTWWFIQMKYTNYTNTYCWHTMYMVTKYLSA